MKRQYLIIVLAIAFLALGGSFAYTYVTGVATIGILPPTGDVATCNTAASQPNWSSVTDNLSENTTKGDVPTGDLFTVHPNTGYSGDLEVGVYLTNAGALIKAYQYLNMQLYMEGSASSNQTPDYRLLTLQNGQTTLTMENLAPIAGEFLQTTKSDFESGNLTNLDTTTSPDDVILDAFADNVTDNFTDESQIAYKNNLVVADNQVKLVAGGTAGTETFRPNAAGDDTNIASQYPLSGAHWDKVDEVTSDNWSTYVTTRTAAIVYEASTEGYSATGQSSLAFNHNLQNPSVNNRLLVVAVGWEDDTTTANVSSITFDGQAMTYIADAVAGATYGTYSGLWYLLDDDLPATTGDKQLSITTDQAIIREIYAVVMEYSGVMQTAPDDYDTDTNDAAGSTSITITAAADGSVAIAGVSTGGTTEPAGNENNVTTRQSQVLNSSAAGGGDHLNVSTGDITFGWNNLATRESMVGAIWQPAGVVSAGIVYEASTEGYSATGQTSLAFNHNLQNPSGSNRLLVAAVCWEDDTITANVSSITYDSQAMTYIADAVAGATYGTYSGLWYLLDDDLPATTGDKQLSITTDQAIIREIYAVVMEYSGVMQTAPDDYDTDTNDAAGSTSITITAAADGSVAIAGVSTGGTTEPAGNENNVTTRQSQVLNSSAAGGGDHLNVSTGDITFGWNNLATRESMVGAIWQPAPPSYARDLYNIPDHSTGSGEIDSVTVYFNFARDSGTGNAYARAAIKTGGTVYTGTEESTDNSTFVTKSYQWITNPSTNTTWTWSEIDALQIGVELRATSTTDNATCTQVYVEVGYTAYSSPGTLTSVNLLSGETVASIDIFNYNASAIPSGAGLQVQYSTDNSTWYNSLGVADGWDTMSQGTANISLSGLGWSGPNFYYNMRFTSDGSDTPILDMITGFFSTHYTSGNLTSSTYDTGDDQDWDWEYIYFTIDEPTSTDIKFQIRSAATEGGLSSATWYGPTGTGDYYTTSGTEINSVHDGDRWIQYRADFSGPGDDTPTLSDIELTYTAAGLTYTVEIIGGGYGLVSANTSEWASGWTITPEFYCEVTQR